MTTDGAATLEPIFPIMRHWLRREQKDRCPGYIPWKLIEPYDLQAQQNHGGQTLKRLAERGGLDPEEALAVMQQRRYRMGIDDAQAVSDLIDFLNSGIDCSGAH